MLHESGTRGHRRNEQLRSKPRGENRCEPTIERAARLHATFPE